MKLYCVVGLGQFGLTVAQTLAASGADVMAVDNEATRLDSVKREVSKAVRLDATDREALRAAGVEAVDTAVVALGENFEAGVLATANLRHLGVGWIVARASNAVQGEILGLVGANRVVYPEAQMAEQLARGLLSPNILEHLRISDNLNLVEMRAPPELVGKTLRELDLRNRLGLNVVVVRRKVPFVDDHGETRHRVHDELVAADHVVRLDDVLVVVGSDEAVRRLSEGRSD